MTTPAPNLEISTVVGCRMACGYCPQALHSRRYNERQGDRMMRYSTFVRCVNKVPKNVQIIFAGMAEPWLNPNCTDMLVDVAMQGYQVGVFTTLDGANVEDIVNIRNFKFLHFCIHLPDDTGIMHLNVTDRYLETLKFAMEIPNHNLVVYGPLHHKVKEFLGRDVPDSSPALISRAGNLPSRAIEPKKGKLKCSACGPNIDHNVLLPNGDVVLCCMDYGQDHILGNLTECSYEDLFKSEAYLKVMRGLEDETIKTQCRQCEISTPA